MTEHYVTICDSTFLPQALALHASLERWASPFLLWIVCTDEEAVRVLGRLELPHVRVLDVRELETDDLRRVRPERSAVEYCWTLTPFAPGFVFAADCSVPRVTYVDADIWFRKNPRPIFEEFESSGKRVLITDHAYAPECDSSARTGQFCVQFMIFTRAGSEHVRHWWEARCLEWCSAEAADGKYGDQKYLDDWPSRFENDVHVLQRPEWTLAPWNVARFPYGPSILYHFQGLALLGPDSVTFGDHQLPDVVVRHVYEPYLASLKEAITRLRGVGFEPRRQRPTRGLLESVKRIAAGVVSQRWRVNLRHHRRL